MTLHHHDVSHYYTLAINKFSRKRGQDVVGYPGITKDDALGRVYSFHPF